MSGRRAAATGFRRLSGRSLALALSAALFLAVVELALRLAPGLLPLEARNAVLTRAVSFPGGVFYRVDELGGMLFQRSDFSVRTYWNGYRWRHSADHLGFRNPPGTPSGLLLLGDSLIYGHGVEEEETVAHVLRSSAGWPAYSMARQGDTLFQSYVLFRLFAGELEPERVLLFPFVNDLWELGVYRSAEELRRAPEIDAVDYDDLRRRLPEIEARSSSWVLGLVLRSRALRLLYHQSRRLLASAWLPRAWADDGVARAEVPPYVAALDDPARFEPALDYYRRILADLQQRCDGRGIAFAITYLNLPWVHAAARAGQERFDDALGELAADLEIPYATTRGYFDGCTACLLPNDGHLSPVGHRLLARFLMERVGEGASSGPR